MRGRYKEFPHTPCPHTCIAFPIINIPHQRGTFFTVDGLTLPHHHPKSIVYIMVHSWCCMFYIIRQMYNDMYPSFFSIIQSSFTLKSPLCFTCLSAPSPHQLPLFQPLATTDFFYSLHSFTFFFLPYHVVEVCPLLFLAWVGTY